MAVRVITIGAPAAGHDWQFTVPGQWYPYLYGVTATMNSAGPLTTLADETGNGHTLTVLGDGAYIFPAAGPYAGGANNGSVSHPWGNTGLNHQFANTAMALAFGPANLTVDGWWKAFQPTGGASNTGDFWGLFNGATCVSGASEGTNTNSPFDMGISTAATFNIVISGFSAYNVWHHVAWTWDGANWHIYRDGALVTTTALSPYAGSGVTMQFCVPGDRALGRWDGSCAGVGFYTSALAAANIANHAAANSSASAYKTAVLADTPLAYWGLNALPTGPSRTVTLFVTDGTKTVAQFPASFPSTANQSFTWSWQALGPGAQSSTDGQINSVPIPELAIAAGYQIGVKTLDLAGTDQWSNINIWFDDGTGPSGGGGGPGIGSGYINALLVPDYSHQGP